MPSVGTKVKSNPQKQWVSLLVSSPCELLLRLLVVCSAGAYNISKMYFKEVTLINLLCVLHDGWPIKRTLILLWWVSMDVCKQQCAFPPVHKYL